ncbi:MAG TPA: hypothetical protein VFX95_10235 [Caulobacteraceae bacterium]|nr:hypothetical protein [Caulobacteraceae bacterium]
MMKPLAALTALLFLAACGEQTPSNQPSATNSKEAAPVVKSDTVPAAFHGVWAATMKDCDAPAETRLEIAADRLRFYESSGPVASVEATGATEILVVVSLSGEGANSRRSFRYRLLGDGNRLFDVRNGLERARCPTA